GRGYTPPMRTYTFFATIFLTGLPGLLAVGCAGNGGGVVDKVLVDFGVREPGADYVSGTDRVFERLDGVGNQEMRRMNVENRQGTVQYQEDSGGLSGRYYREVKVYERHQPLDAQ